MNDYNIDLITEYTTWVSDNKNLIWDNDLNEMSKYGLDENTEYIIF